jgi:hypothetical protein
VPDRADLELEVAAWLTSREGLDAVAAATRWLDDGQEPLRVAERVRGEGIDAARGAAVVAAATARRRARARWPDADRLLFTRTGLEQASDPAVSAWRARRFAGVAALEDRASGLGGDTLALGATGAAVTAIDLDPARLALLRHNAAVRGVEVATVLADALTHPVPRLGPVHVDPGRRDGGRRLRRLAELRPPVPALVDHLAPVVVDAGIAIVLSPAVDLADPDLPGGVELEFVQLGEDLVEAVAWTGALRATDTPAATAAILPADGGEVVTRSRHGTVPRRPVGTVGDHLVEFAPAAVRARLHDEVAVEIDAIRVAERRALFTCRGAPPPPSVWWRTRPIVAVLPARPAAVRRWLATAEDRPVELVRHGVDGDLAAFRRGLGGPPGGPQGWRIELVRLDRGAMAIVTDARPEGTPRGLGTA